MSNTNKSHSKLNISLSFRGGRIAVNMFFGKPYAAHIVKDVAQTLLKILDYPHRCHVLSLRHSSRYPLKKHLPNYRYLHELPHQFCWGICVAQYFSSTAYVTTSRYCFYRKWNFS